MGPIAVLPVIAAVGAGAAAGGSAAALGAGALAATAIGVGVGALALGATQMLQQPTQQIGQVHRAADRVESVASIQNEQIQRQAAADAERRRRLVAALQKTDFGQVVTVPRTAAPRLFPAVKKNEGERRLLGE